MVWYIWRIVLSLSNWNVSAFKTVYSSSIPFPLPHSFYNPNSPPWIPLLKSLSVPVRGVRVRIRMRDGNGWQASPYVCVSGGSTINFHEFLLETIDGIYFVIYLVKWLPLVPHPLSLSRWLLLHNALFCLRSLVSLFLFRFPLLLLFLFLHFYFT